MSLMIAIIPQILAAWIFAELLSGVFHWWEDRYGNPRWPVLGRWVVAPNIEHHKRPRAFTQRCYWTRNWPALVPSLIAAGLCAVCCPGSPWLFLGFLLLSQSNEIHSWAHQRCSWPIRLLQRVGVLQSPRHHAEHHVAPYSTRYCVMSGWLNPVLEWLSFWFVLEALVDLIAGIEPRAERREA